MADTGLRLRNVTHLANLLGVEFEVAEEVKAGEQFPLIVRVRLLDQYRDQAEDIWREVSRHRSWYGGVDVKQPEKPRLGGAEHGACGEGGFYKVFRYNACPDLFRDDCVLIFEGKLRSPDEPKESYDITSRIRNKSGGGFSSWEAPYIDVKTVRVVKH